ncbi:MAG: hypothetical protein QGH37_17490, partial [Candidatus Poribacteria bacterium]|nr:hypothetical protein [Candidatus Poribacteria bacterium]
GRPEIAPTGGIITIVVSAISDLVHVYYNETAFQLLDTEKFEASITRFEVGIKQVPKVGS